MKILVIIPAYNEDKVITGVINRLSEELRHNEVSQGWQTEILIVNDCSTDKTSMSARRAGVRVIDHLINVGAGGATATGLEFARIEGFDVAATMDADGQHDARDVINGIRKIIAGDADLLIGSRLIDTRGMSQKKILGNRGLSLITRILFGTKVSDSQSGLRIFSREAIENLTWESSRYEFCSEMIWRAKRKKLKIDEYPIRAIYTDYSRAKGQNNWNAINIVKLLILRRIEEILE